MPSDARQHLRTALGATNAEISRTVITLFLTCVSVLILSGTDDWVLLVGGDVDTPLVGKTRFEIFMVLAPLIIVALRLFINLQMNHMRRLRRIVKRYRVKGPIVLSADNNRVLFAAGAFAVHILPPAAIAFLGRHVSAIFPVYGLVLYGLSAGLLVWSCLSQIDRRRPVTAPLAAASLLVSIGVGGLLLNNQVRGAIGVLGGSQICDKRFEGPGAELVADYLRQINLERMDFTGVSSSAHNLTCGTLSDSIWRKADLRDSRLWGADLHGAIFNEAELAQTEFSFASMRRAKLENANAWSSLFHEADLDGVSFKGAKLEEARFNRALIDDASFAGARMNYASMRWAELSDVSFEKAKMRRTKFQKAKLWRVDYAGADLEGADFYGAELEEVSFAGALLACVSFRNTTLFEVDFSGVAATELRLIEYGPKSAENIKWPDGFDPAQAGVDYGRSTRCN